MKRSRSQEGEGQCRMSREEIEESIEQREIARANKNWGEADKIRQKLRTNGVQILDKENIWRGEDDSIGIFAGPKGLPEAGIKYIINYREQIRAKKNWALADSLREVLRDQGVQIFDKDGTWRQNTTGIHGLIKDCGNEAEENQARVHPNGVTNRQNSQQTPQSKPGHTSMPHYGYESGFETPAGCVLVIDLIGKREEAKVNSDFRSAETIRQVLGICGVVIDDNSRTYQLPDGSVCELPAMEIAPPPGMEVYGSPIMDFQQSPGIFIKNFKFHQKYRKKCKNIIIINKILFHFLYLKVCLLTCIRHMWIQIFHLCCHLHMPHQDLKSLISCQNSTNTNINRHLGHQVTDL